MNNIEDILERVKSGKLEAEEAAAMLRQASFGDPGFEDLGYAKVDLDRKRRKGNTEVIYGAGKTPEQIFGICDTLISNGQRDILITRLDAVKADKVKTYYEKAGEPFAYYEMSGIAVIGKMRKPDGIGKIAVVTGGTSDMPVAEEASVTAEFLGNEVIRLYDAGVAGIHRLFARLDDLLSADVIIVIAGMEGALASVVGGLVSVPVIAVPTSVGYGASFDGLAALLSMLNSCASGVSVVNIDNGFGAAYQASLINHRFEG
ncbi:MAG: nickel pincer cofactor biosynthesis protein LarB [Lachnospiraceae bacterium]|nr:nickel pincer cofactor biosynthesis protein LarB [Lachnospiraceae bacterium]